MMCGILRIYALASMHKFPQPGRWLATGLALVLAGCIDAWLVALVLSRAFSITDYVFYNSILGIPLGLVHATTPGTLVMM